MPTVQFVSPVYPLRGGIANFTECLASALQEQGAAVHIHSYSSQYPSWLFPGTTQYTTDPPNTYVKALPVTHTIHTLNPISWERTARAIDTQKPDIMLLAYAHPFFVPALAYIALRVRMHSKSTKVLCLTHNIRPHGVRVFCSLLTHILLRQCHGWIALSTHIYEKLVRRRKHPPVLRGFHPVYTFAGERQKQALARAALGLSPNGKYVLLFGLIRPYKRIDIALHALADPRLKENDVHLLIAGEPYMSMSKTESLIDSIKLRDRVHTEYQFIAPERVAQYFSAADVLLQPYDKIAQSGITSLALQFCLPVIASNHGGIAEYVRQGKTGFLVEQKPKEFADAIVEFFDKHHAEDMQKASADLKQELSWNRLAEDILSFARQVELSARAEK